MEGGERERERNKRDQGFERADLKGARGHYVEFGVQTDFRFERLLRLESRPQFLILLRD